MSDETNAQPGAGAGAPADITPQQPAPKNDVEAAQREAAEAATGPTDAEKVANAEAEKQADEKKRNRTKQYIDRINAENAELRRWRAEYEARQQAQAAPAQPRQLHAGPPSLEDHNYDFAAWSQANDAYNRQQWSREQQLAAASRQQMEHYARYNERIESFADLPPDFVEVVGSINPSFLTAELQTAIIGHERGPEIAYYIASNEDALWALSSVRADLLPAAVERIASRLGAAPPAQPGNAPAPQQQPALQPKPISQAPAPAPTVGGRSPTDTPPEKLTDDEWYRRDVERRRKR